MVHEIRGSSVLVLSTDKTSTFVLFEYALRAFIPAGGYGWATGGKETLA